MLNKLFEKVKRLDLLRGVCIIIPLVLFGYFAIFVSPIVSNDTQQYVAMHIRRDPLYCFFLWLLRLAFGPENDFYFRIAVWLQNTLAFYSVVSLTNSVNELYLEPLLYVNEDKKRSFHFILLVIINILCLAPHLITPFVAKTGLVLSSSIMSEAITLPLFYLYLSWMLRMIQSKDIWGKSTWISLTYALILSLARGQMMVMIIAWVVVKLVMICLIGRKKLFINVLLTFALFVGVFSFKNVSTQFYNLEFNNHYMKTTFTGVSLLANVLYASDDSFGEYIEDEEAKRFYQESMNLVMENQLNYSFSEKGIMARGAHLEEVHDKIKFKCIDECWRPIHDVESPVFKADYELETAEQDRIAMIIVKRLLPHCLGRWFYDYIALCLYGFIRTVAVVHPILNIYAALVYLLIVISTLLIVKEYRKAKEEVYLSIIKLFLLTLLIVCANVCGTATVIMCLSRYMIYTLPLVYILLLMNVICLIKIKKTHKSKLL